MPVSNICPKPAKQIVTQFHFEAPRADRAEICSNGLDNMTIMASMPVRSKSL